jgi:UDPglucose 6-dehydrogenase
VLGLAFKPGTDDTRESPSLKVVQRLRDAGAILRLHDPKAMDSTKAILPESPGRLTYCRSPYQTAEGSDALVLLTAWPEYRELDFARLCQLMSTRLIFDGRNLLDPAEMRELGFDYSSMGRA